MAQANQSIPEIQEILKTGLQFGHSTSRWNPKMAKYIFGTKGGIHIIDVIQTKKALEDAAAFLTEAAGRGEIMFVATKRQAATLMQDYAVKSGSHFIVNRWAGGLFTNWTVVQRSLRRLRELEAMFEEGVEGRTKYEISRIKVEWVRLNRLYGGVKQMDKLPVAIVVIDPRFEKVAIQEARKANIPVVALTDTNCDPQLVNYVIPGNDDALRSIELVLEVVSNAILAGQKEGGIKHNLKDYSAAEIKVIKTEAETAIEEAEAALEVENAEPQDQSMKTAKSSKLSVPEPKKSTSKSNSKGMLEMARERAKKQSEK